MVSYRAVSGGLSVVGLLVFDGWDVSAVAVETLRVVPVDPVEGGELGVDPVCWTRVSAFSCGVVSVDVGGGAVPEAGLVTGTVVEGFDVGEQDGAELGSGEISPNVVDGVGWLGGVP